MVILENHGFSQIIGSANAPYITSLSSQGALFTDSHGGPDVLHPSFPNYLQLFSGSAQGTTNDNCPPAGNPFQKSNMFSSLIAAGKTCGGYAESQPASPTACKDSATPALYAGRHVPWPWFGNVPTSVNHNFTAFPASAAGFAALPTMSIVVPDLSHDMHSFGTLTDAQTIQSGDTWVRTHLDGYYQWAKANNSLLFIQFDEDNFTTADKVPTIFVGAHVKQGQYSEHVTHYNFLATIESAYSAACPVAPRRPHRSPTAGSEETPCPPVSRPRKPTPSSTPTSPTSDSSSSMSVTRVLPGRTTPHPSPPASHSPGHQQRPPRKGSRTRPCGGRGPGRRRRSPTSACGTW
jgi:acid phosphatase